MIIDPVRKLGNRLLEVEKPARYSGGEVGSIRKSSTTGFRIALSFPDLYEIGMSNFSIKILYSRLNALEGVACERVFAPAPDFEELLIVEKLPLYSLENGIPLAEFDLLSFSVGYELSATTILTILDRGGIPMRRTDRGGTDPIVVAGGSALTNPAPFADFLDAVYIGEAEGAWIDLVVALKEAKARGAHRRDLLAILQQSPHIWYPGRSDPARRAVWTGFGCEAFRSTFPLPSLSIVQDHGVIEIMRGCPNGCRFCHAGIAYRPHREKSIDLIAEEAELLFRRYGYREITLSSLSTGDYSRLQDLVDVLTARFSSRKISFSLPSLRVNSFTLPILNKISEVRRSGLTFAVETPELEAQRSLNKEVPVGRIIDILNGAKEYGWRNAKFYFMLGLPQDTDETPRKIIEYLEEIRKAVNIRIHLTVNSFIPKPHTPFQRSYQLSEAEALEKIYSIKNGLNRKFYKFGFHSPFSSVLEGLISRGDERVGELIERAYRAGARLDAWEEHLDRDLWHRLFDETEWKPADFAVRRRSPEEALPWDSVDLGVRESYLNQEARRASESRLTDPCEEICTHNCGACDEEDPAKGRVQLAPEPSGLPELDQGGETTEIDYRRFLFSFEKRESARFLSHRNLIGVFQRLFTRTGIPVRYTEGFNPKPKLEFAHPLSLGAESYHEIAMVYLDTAFSPQEFLRRSNETLPEGMRFTGAGFFAMPPGVKSIMSHYWGSDYEIRIPIDEHELIAAAETLFAGYLEEIPREELPRRKCYRLRYPDGNDGIKGIGRVLRNAKLANSGLVEIIRRKSYFKPLEDHLPPATWPDSSTDP